MRKLISVTLLSFLLTACQLEKKYTNSNTNTYYDIGSILKTLYTQPQDTFLKTTFTENQKTQKVLYYINWEKELAFFEQLDINKLGWKDAYQEKRSEKNDTILLQYYPLKENLNVRFLEIKLNPQGKPLHIKAFLQTDNYLYTSEKELNLSIQDGKTLKYSIKGKQKTFFGKTEYFEVYAERK